VGPVFGVAAGVGEDDRDARVADLEACEGLRVLETPLRAPRANPIAERWVRRSATSVSTMCSSSVAATSNTSSAPTSRFTTLSARTARSRLPPQRVGRLWRVALAARGNSPPRHARRADPRVRRCSCGVSAGPVGDAARFLVARNPQEDSRLSYLVQLPLEDGLVLKARAPWPATARVYCQRFPRRVRKFRRPRFVDESAEEVATV
jgi:hypothetical protein